MGFASAVVFWHQQCSCYTPGPPEQSLRALDNQLLDGKQAKCEHRPVNGFLLPRVWEMPPRSLDALRSLDPPEAPEKEHEVEITRLNGFSDHRQDGVDALVFPELKGPSALVLHPLGAKDLSVNNHPSQATCGRMV
jgi:hypothetical protein